jgi:hypothetical protein
MKRKNIFFTVVLAAVLIGMYFLARYGFPSLYTPEWGARHIYLFAAIIIFTPALFGKMRFSLIVLAGYILGICVGELFGGFQSDVWPQFLHYGWLILLITFFVSCIIGAIAEHRKKAK